MLTLTHLRYKNFLQSGNDWTEVPLNTHSSMLIVGENGSGKSTVPEAIYYALEGKPLRDVVLSNLINSTNERDSLVELELIAGNRAYTIRRGQKPKIFEVYEGDTLIPAPADAKDYQNILETTILRINSKSLRQIVTLGGSDYVPFMKLDAATRRKVIEDLLDIGVFSSMSALAKDDASTIKVDLTARHKTLGLLQDQHRMALAFSEQLEEQHQHALDRLHASIVEEETALAEQSTRLTDLSASLETFEPLQQQQEEWLAKRGKYTSMRAVIHEKLKTIRRERSFYEDNDACSTCKQPLAPDLKESRFSVLLKEEEAADKALVTAENLIADCERQLEEIRNALLSADQIRQQRQSVSAAIPVHQRRIAQLKREYAEAQTTKSAIPEHGDVAELARKIQEAQVEIQDLMRRKILADTATTLLKDSGIKARVVKHYLPIINRTINHYLTALDFPIQFTLDSEFKESIKSRYRTEFSYGSFSDGQRKRIDLALLLTWRHIAQIKNSAACNLLVLDEVFDSSLDERGTEEFLKLIRQLEREHTNVIVISHKDQMVDKFAQTVKFTVQRGFSVMKERA